MLRQKIIEKRSSKDRINWRSNEVLRIEAFSDAVFAFAITLLIVSLEVPETFEQLLTAMKGFFAFAVCFTLLFQIWYAQFKYFRRFGIQDTYVIFLTACLLFVVLFYMYPVKFLFTLLLPGGKHTAGEIPITQGQVPVLMIIYGAGFIAVHIIFVLMYAYALKCRNTLELTDEEIFEVRSNLYSYWILTAIGAVSVLFAYISEPENSGYAGLFYLLIGPSFFIFHSIRGNKARKVFGHI